MTCSPFKMRFHYTCRDSRLGLSALEFGVRRDETDSSGEPQRGSFFWPQDLWATVAV